MKKVPIIKIMLGRNHSNKLLSNYLEREGEDTLNRQIVSHVLNTLDGTIKHNILCQFEDDNGSKYDISLEKENWKKSLNKAHAYFLEIEEYETCKIIKEILDQL